jgi:hypothetical protein
MDGHPIPRQITTFEFKLIGFMTLRQFLYLVVTLPLAYAVIQVFPIPLLNILLGVLIATAGIVTAFMPIQDRTLDVWIKNIWKRLQQPTQYYYHKHNDALYFLRDLYFLADPHHMLAHIESKEKLSQYLAMTKQRPKVNYQKKQVNALIHTPTPVLQTSTQPVLPLNSAMQPQSAPVVPQAPAQPAAVVPPAPPISKTQYVVMPNSFSSNGPQSPVRPTVPAAVPVLPAVAALPVLPAAVVIPLAPPIPMPAAPVVVPQIIPPPPQAAQSFPPTIPKATVIPPSQPFFAGLIKTAKKIPIPGVLIYVKDLQNNPVRILKTNPHGVFATYQPLQPGNYTFEIKDPNGTYFFDTMNHKIEAINPDPFEFQSKELL